MEVGGRDALLCGEEVGVDPADLPHRPLALVLGNEVSEDPAHALQAQPTRHLHHDLALVVGEEEADAVLGALLRRLVNRRNPCPKQDKGV